MRELESIPHHFNIYPSGNIPVPVCIGDLPASDYAVSQNTHAEITATHLENNKLVPGVLVFDQRKLIGVIPRHKMFERLGRPYGVELFLRKPIREMEMELGAEPFILKSHLSINSAAKFALGRSVDNVYDPIVVEHEDGSLALLDMYVLLLSQSQLSANLSGIVSSLNNIETILANEMAGASTLNLILDSLNLVVPFHHVCIVLRNQDEIATILGRYETVKVAAEPLERNEVYRSILSLNQPLSLEDVRKVPSWAGVDSPSITRSWMGLPIANQFGNAGLVLLSRFASSPFTINEKELAQLFVRYINSMMVNMTNRLKKTHPHQIIT